MTGQKNKADKPIGKLLFADIILDYWPEWDDMLQIFEKAMSAGNLTVIKEVSHKFEPHGVTNIWLLSESHMAVHTWPEDKFFSVDIFTCGNEGNPDAVLDYIKDNFDIVSCAVTCKSRGIR